MARNITLRGIFEGIGIAGIVAFVFNLGASSSSDAAADNVPTIARLDDEAAPLPSLYAYQASPDGDGSTGVAGLRGLGFVDPAFALPLTDSPAAPVKLRRIVVVRADTPAAVTGQLRAITQNTTQRAKRANRDVPSIVAGVVKRYGTTIQEAGALHNVPAQLMACKISIENPDLLASVVTGGGATGITQIAPGTATDCIRAEYRAGNLLPQELAWFAARLGTARWAAILAGKAALTTTDLKNPQLNIHVGTLAFGQYLRKYTNVSTGEVAVYKAAANYNRGDRAEYANSRCTTPDQVISFVGPGKTSTPKVTQEYIKLYCGPGGPLDYLTRNNLLA